jgi:cell division protein ZapA
VHATARVVSVEILGQRYSIRSALSEAYVHHLASYVDQKIRSAAEVAPTSDTVRLVVLAALNIADERFHAQADEPEGGQPDLGERLARLERLVDQALASGRAAAGA